MEIIYSLEDFDINKPSIFLAGPTARIDTDSELGRGTVTEWRSKLLQELSAEVVAVIDPEIDSQLQILIPENIQDNPDWTYSRQVSWEEKALKASTIIVFGLFRSESLPGFTSNIEFGKWFEIGKDKLVVGGNDWEGRNNYIKEYLNRNSMVFHDKDSLVKEALKKLNERLNKITEGKNFFISDTHFGEERTMMLSKRPFKNIQEHDWTIVRNWNAVVSNNDTVYHLGDFGNPEMVKHLNFKVLKIIEGNYDKELRSKILKFASPEKKIGFFSDDMLHFKSDLLGSIKLVHYPGLMLPMSDFFLFGHIHKLQMVKRNGLNVGVDCHNFTPVNEETVLFYKEAIQKYYDNEVFCNNQR